MQAAVGKPGAAGNSDGAYYEFRAIGRSEIEPGCLHYIEVEQTINRNRSGQK